MTKMITESPMPLADIMRPYISEETLFGDN